MDMAIIQPNMPSPAYTAPEDSKFPEWIYNIAQSATGVNMSLFGSLGDGRIDDSLIFNRAIDFISKRGGGILLLKEGGTYNISSVVYLRSNVFIEGYGATIKSPSKPLTFQLFETPVGAENVGIRGLVFESVNDQVRNTTDLQREGLGSNSCSIRLRGTTNAYFEDITFINQEFGFKIEGSENVRLYNIASKGTYQPIYSSTTNNMVMDTLTLDCTGVAVNKHDHQIYLNSGSTNIRMTNLYLTESFGHMVCVKTNGVGQPDTTNVTVDGLTMIRPAEGITVYNNVKDCRFTNIYGIDPKPNCQWFTTSYGNDNITFENFHVTGGFNVWLNQIESDIGSGLTGRVFIKNGSISGRVDDHFFIPNMCSYVEISGIYARESQPVNPGGRILYNSATYAAEMVIMRDCVYEYKTVAPVNQPIGYRSSGTVIVEGCSFINWLANYSAICYNTAPSIIQFSRNKFQGFTQLIANSDNASNRYYSNEDLTLGLMRDVGNRKKIYGSATPTTGTYAIGDMVENIAPVVGSPTGWTCTVAGSPGTWRSMGVLA